MKRLLLTLFCFAIIVGLMVPMSLVAMADVEVVGTYDVPGAPIALAYDGSSIWVANFQGGTVTKIRASDGFELGTYDVGNDPRALAYDGASIWVANMRDATVTKLRASDGALLGTYAVGAFPLALTFDGSSVWVANNNSGNVMKLRASDGALLGTYAVGGFPNALAFDGADIWVANTGGGNVMKLRALDGTILGSYPVVGISASLAFDGGDMWVANQNSNNVMRLRTSDGAVLATYDIVVGLGLAYDGASLWVADQLWGDHVTRLRASDGIVLGTYYTGDFPVAIIYDGTNVWVANFQGSTVTKLRDSPTPTPAPTPAPTPTPAPAALPDLVVISLSGEWWDGNTTYNVTFRVSNYGTLGAGASVAGVYIDGSWQQDQAVGALGSGGNTNTITVGPFTLSGDSDTIEVRADDNGEIEESDEDNSQQSTFPAAAGPDCFIATSAIGPNDSSVDTLRAFRDTHLTTNPAGSAFISVYYKLSPPVAGFIDEHSALKPVVRVALLPSVGISSAAGTPLALKSAVFGSLAMASLVAGVWARKRRVQAGAKGCE